MTGASNVLDPVEAARHGISRSKHLLAATLDDLTQHHSWLEGYHRAERQRVERLRRQEALRRLKRRRQRAAFVLRRFAIATYAATRRTATFLIRHGHAFAIWATPHVWKFLRVSGEVLMAASLWTWRTGRVLTREGLKAAKDGFHLAQSGFCWSVEASEAAGLVFRRELAAHAATLEAYAMNRSAPARRRAKIGWIRAHAKTRRYAFPLALEFSQRATQTMQHTRSLLERYAIRLMAKQRRALILRPATALVPFEPQAIQRSR